MKRTRWAGRLAGGLLAVASANGCKQQLYLEPADYQDAAAAGQAAFLETRPDAAVAPGLAAGQAPATVLDPDRPAKPLRLAEAVAIALENGAIGGQAGVNAGFGSEALPQFSGRGTSGTDAIRAFALDPAVAAAEIERAVSKFDARFINSITWNKVDQPVVNFQQSFQNGDSAQLSSTLAKPLPTGGVAGITFTTNYQRLSTPPTNSAFFVLPVNYTPAIQFSFEQPLLQGFGVEINQLLPNHPGSGLIQGLRPSGGQGSEGILVTRIRLDQQRAQFDLQLNTLLLNVEGAYWRLLSAYYALQAQEEGLKQSLDSYLFYRARAGRGLAREQVARQAEAQFYTFQNQVVQARGQVLENERQLRLVLNLRNDDGTRLVPVDDLIQAPFTPDYQDAFQTALANRPDLLIQRQEVKAQQLNVLLQKNLRRPDVRFLSSYNIAGIGTRLDGSNDASSPTRNALESLASNQFNSYTLTLRADIPLGFRDANALVRQAQLNLQRSVIQLDNAERKAESTLARFVRQVAETYARAKYNRMTRLAQQENVRLDKQIREEGAISREEAASFIINLIQSQQQLANSTAQEYDLLAQYNIALAGLEFAKGTIQQYNRISVAEGALPAHVGKKAADHFAAREAALELRQHPADGPIAPPIHRAPMTDAQIGAVGQQLNEAIKADGIAPTVPPAGMPKPAAAPPPVPAGNPVGQPAAPPARPVSVPLPATGTRPQLVPADAPGSFSPVGSVSLPTRPTAAAPPPAPGTTPVGTAAPPR